MKSNVAPLQIEEKINVKWGRALLHFSLYLTFALTYQFGGMSKQTALFVYMLFALPTVFLDVLRFYSPLWYAFVNNNLQVWNIIKESEMNRLSGLSEGVIGMMVVMLLCPREVAVVAALCVGSIDPAARIVGMKMGKIKFKNRKSLEGLTAGTVVGNIVVLLFYFIADIKFPLGVGVAVSVGAVGEALVTERDNVIIPISVASTMMLAQIITEGTF